ncbi:alpha/beta hydrolase domain-containing protein [Sinimarinibacterium sp. NLF-5-8]|uniref:alpha/beta hydrolase domain-containing protein n=1 Tax=Sinimarinibacterium sp. NLF-5-8 TaxID=2698684 RepID=UPI00137BA118|nr:alpha/beta hydrolase domain-containing protein [Sinimarinibacterium sp. NLF-5-8]QHS09326.1 hypothetical protein GT972_03585 [Sinimarinibacterium sp. NLF-5-8]
MGRSSCQRAQPIGVCVVWMMSVLLAACGASQTAPPLPESAPPAIAEVHGPIGDAGLRGHALWDSWIDLADLGYDEQEYFVSGVAEHADDPQQTAPYTTRIIVRRPQDPARFNGTVILEWVNVSAQFENAVDTLAAHPLFHRDGYAYVHVSAQAAGLCCLPLLTPKLWDPLRYADLDHPGDDYAFDLFSQIARVFRAPQTADAIDVMAGLPVQRIIAVGQSQSANRLREYLNRVQPHAAAIDAFLIHADGPTSKDYPRDPAVPTLQLLSEREARPEPPTVSHNYRLWEIAGAAHQDYWVGAHQIQAQSLRALAGIRQPADADEQLDQRVGAYGERLDVGQFACVIEGAQFPMRYAVMAAIDALDRWLRSGQPPNNGPRFAFNENGQLARDANGNALGGVRLPPIAVPVAQYHADLCDLGGITIPFTRAELARRYPTHADYQCQMQAATARAMAEGFLLPEDGTDLMQRVANARSRWNQAGTPDDCATPAP